MDEREWNEYLAETTQSAEAMHRLTRIEGGVEEALDAFRSQQTEAFHHVLESAELLQWCHLVCHWFCSKECVLRCLRLAGPPTQIREIPDPREFADVVAKLAIEQDRLAQLVDIVEHDDVESYHRFIEEHELYRFSHLLCHWICSVRCHLVCRWVCERVGERPNLLDELVESGRAIRRLASSPRALAAAVKAIQTNDCERLRAIIAELGLAKHCVHICWWLCSWRCFRVCLILCRRFLDDLDPEPDDEEILQFAKVTAWLAEQPEHVAKLARALHEADENTFGAIVEELRLQRFCIQLCHWLCGLYCRRFCICVCPPLLARIDAPGVGTCASSTVVPACTGGAGPLVGIEIVGSAAGGGFDRYTLRYSWGGGSPIDAAVVYPDCSRPPAATSSSTPVVSGVLGWLDVTLLPAGVTSFTVHLDVFDSGGGTASDTTTFAVRTEAIEISAVATRFVVEGENPFHPGVTSKLVKDADDPSVMVPEISVGGGISVDGSAYVIGCDRILSQYELVRFDAPLTAPPPTPTTTGGGSTTIITPVPYVDVPQHPWQSGCFSSISPNTIINGNLVSRWSSINCRFLGVTYQVPKVRPVPNWVTPASGRYVVLVQANERPVAGPWAVGSVAGVDRVVVWIDNDDVTARITAVGGVAGCGDILLSSYVGGTAAIEGAAWDPPIVPTAPQAKPNDNFSHYALSFQKNGEVGTTAIPAATPGTRVPNVWPGPLGPNQNGTLANWDIVAAIDHNAGGPTPTGKLARGERCAYNITLAAHDETHVGDSGNHHRAEANYAVTIINDL